MKTTYIFLSLCLTSTLFAQELVPFKDPGGYGYKNVNTREVVVESQYDNAYDFVGDRAVVMEGGRYGAIDLEGKIVIPLEYSYMESFTKLNCAIAKKNNKMGLLDKQGKTLIAFEYEGLRGFDEGVTTAKKNGKWGAISLENEVVIPFEYKELSYYPKNGFAIATNDEGFAALIRPDNSPITEFQYKYVSYSDNPKLLIAWKEKAGLLSSEGKEILPFEYDNIQFQTDGFFPLQKGELFGYASSEGELLQECLFEADRHFEGKYWYLRTENKLWHLWDADENTLTEMPFDDLKDAFGTNGWIGAVKDDLWGYVDNQGNERVPYEYELVDDYENGQAVVVKKGKTLYLDEQGKKFKPKKTNIESRKNPDAN